MSNLDFLKKVLMSDTHYWIVARKEFAQEYGREKRQPDSIWFVAIDYNIQLSKKYEEITLSDIEKLQSSNVSNISLSEDYPPFQIGISMYNIYKGFPIPEVKGIKEVMTDAINLKSKDFYAYESVIKKQSEPSQQTENK